MPIGMLRSQNQSIPEFDQEMLTAREFLVSKGASINGLRYRFSTETLMGFSDDGNHLFAIVARRAYQKYLSQPVLAYSLESQLWNSKNTESSITLSQIIGNYNRQLLAVKAGDSIYQGSRVQQIPVQPTKSLKPLLGNLAYGQKNPYNSLFPSDPSDANHPLCVTGCGAVALAHILSYHRHTVQPAGTGLINLESGTKMRIDLSQHPVDWNGSDSALANLMLDCAASLAATVSSTSSTSTIDNFKSALICYWDYSPQCIVTKGTTDMQLLALTYSQLDKGHPVIVAGDNHIFVCDGYDNDYLHFNFGWDRNCNGYYRAIALDNNNENLLPFNELITEIQPMGDTVSLSVNVLVPGTLSTLIDTSLIKDITSLTVKGTINGDDIRLLRNMAGAIDVYSPSLGIGSLMHLDLTDAVIKGGRPYAVFYADGYTISGTEVTANNETFRYSYNLSNISDSQWRTITNYKLYDRGDMFLERDDNKRIYISYHSRDNVIGKRMFAGCHNLRTVILPDSALSVDEDAFYDCRSLEQAFNLPAKVNRKAFNECRLINP